MTPDPAALSPLITSAARGFTLSLSLIVAIGAQNAFVLRQGLRREHVLPVVLVGALADATLMALGVAGMAGASAAWPALTRALAIGGVGFLVVYGLLALRRAAAPKALNPSDGPSMSLPSAVLQMSAFTFLNPHVYLDTVLLVGSVGAQQPGPAAQASFAAAGAAASGVWFFGLGFGARWLAPLFRRPQAWQLLDGVIGVSMFWLAWQLWPLVSGAAPVAAASAE